MTELAVPPERSQQSFLKSIKSLTQHLQLYPIHKRKIIEHFTGTLNQPVQEQEDEFYEAVSILQQRWIFCIGQGFIQPSVEQQEVFDLFLGNSTSNLSSDPWTRQQAIEVVAKSNGASITDIESQFEDIAISFCNTVVDEL